MWDMANDREYIKIRNKSKTGRGWRENNKINTGGVICGEGLLADLVQRYCEICVWIGGTSTIHTAATVIILILLLLEVVQQLLIMAAPPTVILTPHSLSVHPPEITNISFAARS